MMLLLFCADFVLFARNPGTSWGDTTENDQLCGTGAEMYTGATETFAIFKP
ncbi:MAG: hypothetical protein AB1648_02780 [Pseudomonadota bacterium]